MIICTKLFLVIHNIQKYAKCTMIYKNILKQQIICKNRKNMQKR